MSPFSNLLARCLGWLNPAEGRKRAAGRRFRGRPSPRPRARRLELEPLEQRQVLSPAVLDPNLGVRTVVSGLIQPTTMAFLGDNDFFVLEKTTGKVQHVINGVLAGTALDLPVNSASG